MKKHIVYYAAQLLNKTVPQRIKKEFFRLVFEEDSNLILESIGPILNKHLTLKNMPMDLDFDKESPSFENLTGLFASTAFDHGVVSMTIRQAGYLFGLVKRLKATKIIEIGRFKGGSTLILASAMKNVGRGQLWSIDQQEKEQRLYRDDPDTGFDVQLNEKIKAYDLDISLIVGDSKRVEIETGKVDLVFIDGDHSYEGVKSDFERFAKRLRVGGAVLFDDAFNQSALFSSHSNTVGRLVSEIIKSGDFRFVKRVDRLAHLERIHDDDLLKQEDRT